MDTMKKKIWLKIHVRGKAIKPKIRTLVAGFLLFAGIGLLGDFKPFYVNYNFPYGARALGMSNAFVAVADDLTAVALNPAGLAFMNYPRVDVSFRSGRINYDFLSQVGDNTNRVDLSASLKEINFFSLAVPALLLDMRFHFALSYYRYIPYGSSGEWRSSVAPGGDTFARDATGISFTGSGGLDVLGFSTSFLLLKGFSFGITLQQFINNGTMTYEYALPHGTAGLEVNEKLSGRNLVIGLLAKPMEDLVFAIAYHTRMSGTFNSQSTYRENGTVEVGENPGIYINIPARLSLGMAARLLPSVNLSYEFSKILWSRGTVGALPYPIGDNFSFQQSDIINHRLGIEGYIPLQKVEFFVRGGLSWERQLFVSSHDKKVILKGVSWGLGVRFSRKVSLDLAYMHQRGDWLESDLIVPTITGDAAIKNDVLALSFSYIFAPKLRPKPSFFNPGRK